MYHQNHFENSSCIWYSFFDASVYCLWTITIFSYFFPGVELYNSLLRDKSTSVVSLSRTFPIDNQFSPLGLGQIKLYTDLVFAQSHSNQMIVLCNNSCKRALGNSLSRTGKKNDIRPYITFDIRKVANCMRESSDLKSQRFVFFSQHR